MSKLYSAKDNVIFLLLSTRSRNILLSVQCREYVESELFVFFSHPHKLLFLPFLALFHIYTKNWLYSVSQSIRMWAKVLLMKSLIRLWAFCLILRSIVSSHDPSANWQLKEVSQVLCHLATLVRTPTWVLRCPKDPISCYDFRQNTHFDLFSALSNVAALS